MRLAAPVLVLCVALAAAGCGGGTAKRLVPGGDPDRGAKLIVRFGCGSCHDIPGIEGADGRVGPSLHNFADERNIAGEIPNTPRNAVRWIMHPRRIEPGTIMPDLGVTRRQARDIAAYLYSR
jgi:cytochrome c2